jgi:hypothetical protein
MDAWIPALCPNSDRALHQGSRLQTRSLELPEAGEVVEGNRRLGALGSKGLLERVQNVRVELAGPSILLFPGNAIKRTEKC